MEKKRAKKKKIAIAGAVALTAAGCVIIPSLIKKAGSKMYKSSLKKDKIDFDNMGPEIVKNDSGKDDEGDN